ncbi:MAG: class II aldolase/adducin family protein [Acidimicrobiia bacterium]|nr:class II aldolase/adducin family protein [Acidimicrobiia bacterium]
MTTTDEPTTDAGLRLPRPGETTSVEEERMLRKLKLAGALRIFGRFGFSEGVAGHITARDPEFDDHFWVNPFGVSFNRMKVSDLLLVNDAGEVVEGDRSVNDAAFAIHSAIHAARPDVVAAAHSHAVHSRAFSTLGKLLDPLTQDACAFYGDHALHPDFGGVVADVDYGRQLAATLGSHKAVIHQNHGAVTVGASVDEAVWWFITLERSCQAQLLADAAGTPIPIPHDAAALTASQVGTSIAGWFQFQPLWDDIVAEQPDFAD